jgi:four helix bundle protein
MSLFNNAAPPLKLNRNEERNDQRNDNRNDRRNDNRNDQRNQQQNNQQNSQRNDRRNDQQNQQQNNQRNAPRNDHRNDRRNDGAVPADKLTDFQQLNVWQKAHKLVLEVYELTRKFPKEERSEMRRTVRRTATVIPAKIAEGFMRRNPRDKEASYRLSQDAIEELKCYLILSRDLGFLKDTDETVLAADEVGRMLTGLVRAARHGN